MAKTPAGDPVGARKDLRPRRAYGLTDELRHELALPLGPVYTTAMLPTALRDATMAVAIGDVVSLTLLELGLAPRIFACDFKTQRGTAVVREHHPVLDSGTSMPKTETTAPSGGFVPPPAMHYRTQLTRWGTEVIQARNPAGSITREAWDAVRKAFASKTPGPVRLEIDGEEDLLGIPAILEAPDGTAVLYGLPGQGVVVVKVDAAMRKRAEDIVARMTS